MKKEIKTVVSRRLSTDQCRTNPKTVFVFGDSLERYGEAGQAVIRSMPNSIGFATKKKPSLTPDSFFTDNEYEDNCKIIEEEIEKIHLFIKETKANSVAFSKWGIGTGLSSMPQKCPLTFLYLCKRLIEAFKFNNIEFLESKQF